MNTDFETSHLNPEQKKIAESIIDLLKEVNDREPDGGGCKAFYTPEEWKEKGERYGTESALVLVHDGGDLAPFCNLDYQCYERHEALNQALDKIGYYFESCTHWYAAVYKV